MAELREREAARRERRREREREAERRGREAERREREDAELLQREREGAARANAERERRLRDAERRLKAIEEENRRKAEEARNYPLPRFLRRSVKSGKVNLAVTGNPGVGKSSFVNFIRNVTKQHPAYARVGVQECTLEPTPYATESGEVLWDLPGVGTPTFRQETYLKTMGIRYFDVVFLITGDRFTEAEHALRKELVEFQVPFFCVRNKVDLAWEAKIAQDEEDGNPVDERALKEETVDELRSNFREQQGIAEVYLMSCRQKCRYEFDFEQLQRDVERAVTNARAARSSFRAEWCVSRTTVVEHIAARFVAEGHESDPAHF